MELITPIGGSPTTTTAGPAISLADASTPGAGATSSAPPDNATLDKDAFLTLLVAQLKYQDPTAPTDVSQMMSQTSQLSMVERLDQIAEGIDALGGGGGALTSAANMLGRQVTFDNGTPTPVTATVESVRMVDGQTVLSAGGYDVPLDALIEVRDATAPPAITPSTPPVTPSTSPTTTSGSTTGTGTADSTDSVDASDAVESTETGGVDTSTTEDGGAVPVGDGESTTDSGTPSADGGATENDGAEDGGTGDEETAA